MNSSGPLRTAFVLCSLALALQSPPTFSQASSTAAGKEGQRGIGSGSLAEPAIGEFKNGRGEFYNQETLNGKAILVRFVISDITPTSCRFEQAFSDDGGKTWEVNWIATDTRV
jgi:hypothetical protein